MNPTLDSQSRRDEVWKLKYHLYATAKINYPK